MKATKTKFEHRKITLGLTGRICTSSILPLLLLLAMPALGQAQLLYETNHSTIPNTLIVTGYLGPDSAVTIPSTKYGMQVTAIGAYAFGEGYEGNVDVTSVTIPNSVTSIGEGAFAGQYLLESVNIPNGVTSIAIDTFSDCEMLRVTIPNGVTNIGSGAFYHCSALGGPLGGITIPPSVTTIGSSAFAGCLSLEHVTIPDSVTSLGGSVFYECYYLESVTIGNGVTSIGGSMFFDCYYLSSVTLGNSVTSIGYDAFEECKSLGNITIPESVTSIGDVAFWGCSALTSIYFRGDAPNIGNNVFAGDNQLTVYYLPGTAGWGPTFGGRPTALWILPHALNGIVTISMTTYQQNTSKTNGDITTTLSPKAVAYSTKTILNVLAFDKHAKGTWPSNSFPATASLALSGSDFVVQDGADVLIRVSDIMHLSFGANIIKSGSHNNVTGLASPSEIVKKVASIDFDDTAIVGGKKLKFYLQGILNQTTTDTVPVSGVYTETLSAKLTSGAGEGSSGNVPLVCTGSATAAGTNTFSL